MVTNARVAQLVELYLAKVVVVGPSPISRSNIFADIAQLIEHRTCNAGVGGLSPSVGSTI